jgi:GTP-binding protein
MKIKSADFKTSATDLASSPRWPYPEFPFIGRSNVGKSSIVNMLTERRDLAKVSQVPGKTKLLNFFLINGTWGLVDLPGYGYAKVAQQDKHEFNVAVSHYLERRENIACVFVLIDSRLTPQAIDLAFVRWLERFEVDYALVFTKTDKHSASVTHQHIDLFTKEVSAWRTELPPIFKSSSKTKAGRTDILNFIEQTLAARKASA